MKNIIYILLIGLLFANYGRPLPLLVTAAGTSYSCVAGYTNANWVACRYNLNGNSGDYTSSPTTASVYASSSAIGIKTIRRIGLVFNMSLLPDNIYIDSVKLQLYKNGAASNIGIAAYSGTWLDCTSSTIGDYTYAIGTRPVEQVDGSVVYENFFDAIGTKPTLSAGWNTISLATVPFSNARRYGSDYVSIGIGEYQHDYVGSKPPNGWTYSAEFDINDTNLPILTVYYSLTPPSANSVKIYTIF